MHQYNPSTPRPANLSHRTDDIPFRINVARFILRRGICLAGRTPTILIRDLYEDAAGDKTVFSWDVPEDVKGYIGKIFNLDGLQDDPVFFSVLVLCSLPKSEDVKLDVIQNMFKAVNEREMDDESPQLAVWALGFSTPKTTNTVSSWGGDDDPLHTTPENTKKMVRLVVRWASKLLEEKRTIKKQIVDLYEKVENKKPLTIQDQKSLLKGSKIGPSKFMALLFLSTRDRALSSTTARNFYKQMYNTEVKTKTVLLFARFSGAPCPRKVVPVFVTQAPKTDLSWGVRMSTAYKHALAAQEFLADPEKKRRFIRASTEPGDDLDLVFHKKPVMFAFVAAQLLVPSLSQNNIKRFYKRLTGSQFNTNFLNMVTWYAKHKMAIQEHTQKT